MNTAALADAVLGATRRALGPAENFISLHEPEFAGREWDYVKECLDTGWVSSVGGYVDRFERDLASVTSSGYAVAVVNGTAALHLSLLLIGVAPGDEVIIPTLSFVATATAVAYCQAIPHFADASIDTLGLDPVKLDAHLGTILDHSAGRPINRVTGRPVAAVVCMHTFGHPVDLDGVIAVCAKHRLPLVEDAAESLGSTYRGRHCGTFAPISALSFNGNKIVTTGGGGAVLTADAAMAKRAKHLSTTAKIPHPWLYSHDAVGFNYRLPNLNAALGCAQLERLPNFLARKRRLAEAYGIAFADVEGVDFFREKAPASSNYWLNAILLPDAPDTAPRDAVLERLNGANYMARPAWTLLHKLQPYAASPRMPDLSTALSIERRLINLPSSPRLAEAKA